MGFICFTRELHPLNTHKRKQSGTFDHCELSFLRSICTFSVCVCGGRGEMVVLWEPDARAAVMK